MHKDHHIFILAQKEQRKIILTYYSGVKNLDLTRLCIPLCYCKPGIKGKSPHYYFWDSMADAGELMLYLETSQIKYMELGDKSCFKINNDIFLNQH
jgi:hypothetical protein